MDSMCIILIVKIWNVLDVNRLGPVGDYICVCPTRVASTELETVGNDSRSIPEEEEEKGGRCCGTGSGKDIKPALIGYYYY